jgi:hypothetical protein
MGFDLHQLLIVDTSAPTNVNASEQGEMLRGHKLDGVKIPGLIPINVTVPFSSPYFRPLLWKNILNASNGLKKSLWSASYSSFCRLIIPCYLYPHIHNHSIYMTFSPVSTGLCKFTVNCL